MLKKLSARDRRMCSVQRRVSFETNGLIIISISKALKLLTIPSRNRLHQQPKGSSWVDAKIPMKIHYYRVHRRVPLEAAFLSQQVFYVFIMLIWPPQKLGKKTHAQERRFFLCEAEFPFSTMVDPLRLFADV